MIKKIQELASARQSLGLKTRSKKYDNLIKQVKGFIKTEINRLLNDYFARHQDIQTVAVEKLNFRSPELSSRLNRIIQNFGYGLFKAKLDELSLFYGFVVEEFNPAYTSQECHNCGYVDKNNRKNQAAFECLCCKTKLNADVQGSRVVSKRFRSQQSSYKFPYKGIILRKLKLDFVKRIDGLLSHGQIGRRNLYNLISKNNYFKYDLKEIARTTSDPGLGPMTILNYDKYLQKYYYNLE
jgi:putative transposase